MNLRLHRALAVSACLGLSVLATAAAAPAELSASNTTPIVINHVGQASAYESQITVEGLRGDIQNVTVTLKGVSHTFPDDIEVLLVAPGGQKIKLMSDVGGSTDLNGATLSFSANAGGRLADNLAITSGTYLPSDITEGDALPVPAPAPPYSVDMTTLQGAGAAQNGTWSLYVYDDSSKDGGMISGGWSLDITSAGFDSCAAEGYSGSQYSLCHQICEASRSRSQGLQGLTNAWTKQFGTRPPCAE